MTYLTQTRVNTGRLPHQRGNGFATAIACLMGLDDPEDVIQIQEYYDQDQPDDPGSWVDRLFTWLRERGYAWNVIDGHQYNDQPYIVIGVSSRSLVHACIYRNGKLLHDPYPDGEGLVSEEAFETITPIQS